MRLFLASQDFGRHADVLRKMTNNNRKVLVITNARDYAPQDTKEELMARKTKLFASEGFDITELDLRKFFHRSVALERFIDQHCPGLVYAVGGNVFLLSTAMHASGFNEIIARKLQQDELIYGGGSAGAMVAASDLRVYETGEEANIQNASETYGLTPITRGLGLIDSYVVPHVGHPKLGLDCEARLQNILKISARPIMLNDNQVLVVNNDRNEVI